MQPRRLPKDVMPIVATARTIELFLRYSIATSFRAVSRIKAGDTLFIHKDAILEKYSTFTNGKTIPKYLGAISYTKSEFSTGSSIGRYCSIGGGVSVMGDPHPMDRISTSPFTYHGGLPGVRSYISDAGIGRYPVTPYQKTDPDVFIDHDVWIGDGALLARGIRLGTGCVVAARAIVTRDVMPYEIVGGVPARKIRLRFADDICERLLASSWWQYAPDTIMNLDPSDMSSFLDRFEAAVERKDITPFDPGGLSAAAILATV